MIVPASADSSPSEKAEARKNKIIIPFEVPYNGAVRELEIASTTSFDAFLDKLAHGMSTRKSLLSGIAYTASFQPKNPKPVPKLLEDEKSWEKLVTSVEAHVAASLGNKKGKGVIKPFTIRIVDTSGGDTKTAVSGKKVQSSRQHHIRLDTHRFQGKER